MSSVSILVIYLFFMHACLLELIAARKSVVAEGTVGDVLSAALQFVVTKGTAGVTVHSQLHLNVPCCYIIVVMLIEIMQLSLRAVILSYFILLDNILSL